MASQLGLSLSVLRYRMYCFGAPTVNDEHLIAHALAFASNLMLGGVSINEALAIARKRFGIDVYFRKSKTCEIIREQNVDRH
jgi:hypothetical protein